MSSSPTFTPSVIDHRIRSSGKAGRLICNVLLGLSLLLGLGLAIVVAFNPTALVRLNLNEKRVAQIDSFKQEPAKLVNLLETKPSAVLSLAKAEKEANHFQDLAEHKGKRALNVAAILLLTGLVLGFIWLVRKLFDAFAEGQVFTAENARTLRWLGVIVIAGGALTLNVGIVVSGLLNVTLGWSLNRGLDLQAEQSLVI